MDRTIPPGERFLATMAALKLFMPELSWTEWEALSRAAAHSPQVEAALWVIVDKLAAKHENEKQTA